MKQSVILGLWALLLKTSIIKADVLVTDIHFEATIASYHSISASFGKSIPENGLHGAALGAEPEHGCVPIQEAPIIPGKNISWIAVIARYGGCTFEEKVRNAMNANFSGAIIYNIDSNKVPIELKNQVIPMGGQDDDLIPSVFIGASHGKQLLNHFTFEKNPNIRIILTDDEPFDINAYLLPFAIVVGICFVIMLGIVIYKCVQDHRRRIRHRLPKSALKKLPIHKFKPGDPFETCCICLDDFEENDKLRILPCDHGYHSKCIDPWLVKNKRICPQCRKRVFARGSGYSSESDDTERAPLIRQASTSSGGGTFGGPSTSAAALRRMQNGQQPVSSVQSEPSTSAFLTTNESRRLLQHRRFRRPRRLRRVYEVLSESTTSSENEEEGLLGEAAGGGDEPTFVVNHGMPAPPPVMNLANTSIEDRNQGVSAQVHVQVHGGQLEQQQQQEEDESEESLPEIKIYRTGRTSSDSVSDGRDGQDGRATATTTTTVVVEEDEESETREGTEIPPNVVVTDASGSPPAPQGATAENA